MKTIPFRPGLAENKIETHVSVVIHANFIRFQINPNGSINRWRAMATEKVSDQKNIKRAVLQ